MSDMPPTASLLAAMDEMQAGRGAEAESIVWKAVQEAREQFGAVSFEHAAALFDVGRFFAAIGDYPQAARAIQQAADLDLPGDRGRKDRLTYLRNLGEMYRFANQLDQAEQVLRAGLDERRLFYGPEHAGYAFGLEALAEVIWLRGDPQAALPMIQDAVALLWREGNPETLSALSLAAYIHHAARIEGSAFASLPRLADEDLDEITGQMLFRANHIDTALTRAVLADYADWMGTMRGETHASLIGLVAKIADCERILGEQKEQQETLEHLVGVCEANGDISQAIKAVQGLALAQDEAGLKEAAEQSYRRGLAWAREFGERERLSSILRNFGFFLNQQDRRDEAEVVLREAVAEGKAALDPEAHGRGLAGLGVFVQHSGRLDEARAMLEEALQVLPPSHPDTLIARSHLDAITSNHSCGCGDMEGAFSEALKALVLPSLPPGLIESLNVNEGEGVQVHLAREPTPEEQELLGRVINHAMRELRKQIEQRGYS